MIFDLREQSNTVILRVKAIAGARSNEIRGVHDGALKVAVTQVAEKGKANKAIAKVLASKLQLTVSQVELVSGHTHSRKEFALHKITVDELRERLHRVVSN